MLEKVKIILFFIFDALVLEIIYLIRVFVLNFLLNNEHKIVAVQNILKSLRYVLFLKKKKTLSEKKYDKNKVSFKLKKTKYNS